MYKKYTEKHEITAYEMSSLILLKLNNSSLRGNSSGSSTGWMLSWCWTREFTFFSIRVNDNSRLSFFGGFTLRLCNTSEISLSFLLIVSSVLCGISVFVVCSNCWHTVFSSFFPSSVDWSTCKIKLMND